MITRHLKLKLYKSQEKQLNEWLWYLTGVYNWASLRIKKNAENKIYFSKIKFQNSLVGVSKKLEIPSHTIQGILLQSYNSWSRCFKKTGGEPRLKGVRNKLCSIPFPDPIKPPKSNRIFIPGIGETRLFKQDIPEGKIKCGRIIKKSSGWYLILTIDTDRKISNLKETKSKVGIDTGFHDLVILSDGTKYENPRELRLGAKRLAQAQRGKNKKLVARLQEKQSNRRKDRNHKISIEIIRNHKEIYVTNDNLKSQSKRFGKSITEASIGQLRQFLIYKGSSCGRKVVLVDSHRTTMTCSNCDSLSGPTGLKGLAVRDWVCIVCRTQHDRDVNAAQVVLKIGAGCALGIDQPNVQSIEI